MKKLRDIANDEIEEIMYNFPTREAALIPLFHLANKHFGKIEFQVLREISSIVNLPEETVKKLFAQYKQFWPSPANSGT